MLNEYLLSDFSSITKDEKDIVQNLRNKTILITGCYGLITTYLIYYLIYLNEKENYNIKILGLGRNKNKFLSKYKEFADKSYLIFVNQDINDEINLNEKVDIIIHAASLASPQYYKDYPVEVMLPNVIGTNNLLKFACKNKIEQFLYFSTSAIYGKLVNDETRDENNLGILNQNENSNCYGISKKMGEALGVMYSKEYNVPFKSIRLYHSYGPTLDIDGDERLFSQLVKNMVNDENIVLETMGYAKRAFCYMSDVIVAIMYVLFKGDNQEAYNLLNPEGFISVRDLAEALISLFPEKNLKVIYNVGNTKKLDMKYQDLDKPASAEKLYALGWRPKVNIKEGFKRTILSIKLDRNIKYENY